MTLKKVDELVEDEEPLFKDRSRYQTHLGVRTLEDLRVSAMLGILPYFIDAKRKSDNSANPPWYRRIRSEAQNPADYELSFRKSDFDEVLNDSSGGMLRGVVSKLCLTSDVKKLFVIDEESTDDPYYAHRKTPLYELLVRVLRVNKLGLYARLRKNLPGIII